MLRSVDQIPSHIFFQLDDFVIAKLVQGSELVPDLIKRVVDEGAGLMRFLQRLLQQRLVSLPHYFVEIIRRK